MEILQQDEHLCNATFMILLWTQNIHVAMLKYHLHTTMILILRITTLENAWNISENALLMISSLGIVFLKCKNQNKLTNHPNTDYSPYASKQMATNSTITFN